MTVGLKTLDETIIWVDTVVSTRRCTTMSDNDSLDARRLREWASLTGDRLPEKYGVAGPELDGE